MVRKASAVWSGVLKTGNGLLSTDSGVLNETPYSFHTRFEDGNGTNPEELIAAAHAGCFSMALSSFLEKAGFTAERISTTASVKMEAVDGDPTVVESHLDLTAKVPGIDEGKFQELASAAKAKCPISRLLKCTISLSATLEG